MLSGGNTCSALDSLFHANNYLYFHDAINPPARRGAEVEFLVDALDLKPEMSLLDLGCGHGRHANILATHVREVTAVDRSTDFLAIAREEARRKGLDNIYFEEKDIRNIEYVQRFDRVVLANTIFGLFSDTENSHLLERTKTSLRRGGRLFVDVINRDTILTDFRPQAITQRGEDYLLEQLSFDPATGRMSNKRVYMRMGKAMEAPFSLKLYNFSEISLLLFNAGLRIVRAYEGWSGDPFTATSKKILLVAERID